ncbi:hypothetical protein [Paenibacillus sp. NPDC058071]|uniref:hypothetical protein n=1 Tax=Paenibacillus sp. NPDC058071 TaxID=3346326 RepID=UPI0036DB190C
MKSAKMLLLLILVMFTGCSAAAPASTPDNNDQLNSIDVSQYRTGTTRTQPELISVYSEQKDLASINNWFMEAGDSVTLPDLNSIEKIQVVSFFYKNSGESLKGEAYMLVTFKDGSYYSKQVQPPSTVMDAYPYQESDNEQIINRMGIDGWRSMGSGGI